MKKILKLSFVALACALLAVSCSKAGNEFTPDNPKDENPVGKVVTISATLSDALTKVAFAPDVDGSGKAILKLTWEAGDKLIVADHDNTSSYAEFDLVSGADGTTATFSGTLPTDASSYDVSIKNIGTVSYDSISQAADNDASHLEYIAAKKGLTDLDSVVFDEVCGVLGITAKLPAGVAAGVRSVSIAASESIFNSGNTLIIALDTPGDEGNDDILRLYAPLPATSQGITSGTTLLIRFNDRYTRFIELGASTFTPGKLNEIKVNCSTTDKHAGAPSCTGSTLDNPYLIGDGYQLAAINGYASQTAKTYFKMVDNVDMSGITHTPINEDITDYSIVVDFNGNHKTISKLSKSLFYVFKGSIYDLTLDLSETSYRGILAEYIQGSGNVITAVNVSNGKVNATESNVGGLVGNINKSGTSATISGCTVSDTDVSGAGVVGGLIGFADALVIISECTYTGGSVSSSGRYCGGILGSTGNYNSVISDCHVLSATISSSATDDARCGGFCGQVQTKVQIKGCTVGTESQRVNINLGTPASNKVLNSGGFAGTSYGTITKNGDARCKAYVKISSSNTSSANVLNLGGFAGYHQGTIEYSDVDADITGQKGQYIGGFIGRNVTSGVVRFCTSNASVNGDNYTGGFVGNIISGGSPSYEGNIAAGSVSAGATVGGFAGNIASGTITKCSTSCTVSGTTNIGGFAGQINGAAIVSRCSSNGTTTASGNVCGGFAGVASNGASISDSFSTSDLNGTTRKRGGLVALFDDGTLSVTRCYATGSISNNFETGGLIGFANVEGLTMTNSAAWNNSITASSILSTNWSTGAIVGVTYLKSTLTDNYRNPDMKLTAYWGNYGGYTLELTNYFQHPDVSPSAPLTDINGNEVTHANVRPYNGKCETGKTLSQLASTTLDWSSAIWDFTGDLPTLK